MTTDHPSWLELAQHAHTGDPVAFDAFARPLTYWITRYCRARAGEIRRAGVTVEELTQNTLVELWKALQPPRRHHWHSDAHVLAWVHAITTSCISNASRISARTAHVITVDDVDRLEVTTGSGLDPSRVAAAVDEVEHTSAALATLSPRQRDALLGHASGEPDHAIAARLGSTLGSVRVLRHHALTTLRQRLRHTHSDGVRC